MLCHATSDDIELPKLKVNPMHHKQLKHMLCSVFLIVAASHPVQREKQCTCTS